MADDRRALEELFRASEQGASHLVRHYLYFPDQKAAAAAAAELSSNMFTTEVGLDAYSGQDWLVLATHRLVPSDESMAFVREWMEALAARFGGEYDGWEAEVTE